MFISIIDEMLDTWADMMETDEDLHVFNRYKDRVYDSVNTLLQKEREKLLCSMLVYFYPDNKENIVAEMILAKMLNQQKTFYRGICDDERMAFHIANFVSFYFGDSVYNSILNNVKTTLYQ